MAQPTQQRRYVRITDTREDGFVEFDFFLGDPDLYVELILPARAFEEFCAANQVSFLSDADGAALEADRAKWRQGGLE